MAEEYIEYLRGRLESVFSEARGYLEERDEVRERAIRLSRDVIRYSGWAITEYHKGDAGRAREYLAEAEARAREFLSLLEPYPELYYSGMAYNALSEYVEAVVFMAIAEKQGVPGPGDLGVPIVPYLQGLGDVVGELRRLAMEKVRQGDYQEAWRLYRAMELIYLYLRGLDFPEALAPGIRHKADVARRLTDDTKAFLVDMESRERLTRLLGEAISTIKPAGAQGYGDQQKGADG